MCDQVFFTLRLGYTWYARRYIPYNTDRMHIQLLLTIVGTSVFPLICISLNCLLLLFYSTVITIAGVFSRHGRKIYVVPMCTTTLREVKIWNNFILYNNSNERVCVIRIFVYICRCPPTYNKPFVLISYDYYYCPQLSLATILVVPDFDTRSMTLFVSRHVTLGF